MHDASEYIAANSIVSSGNALIFAEDLLISSGIIFRDWGEIANLRFRCKISDVNQI